jgi:hypothetical protein
MPSKKSNHAAKNSLLPIGALFVGLSVVSFLLQINFLNLSCSREETQRMMSAKDTYSEEGSGSALRRRDESLAAEAYQQTNNGDPNSGRTSAETDDDNIVTGPQSTDLAAIKNAIRAASPPTRPRVLIGIFSADFPTEQRCRHRQRKLLRTHPHVCSLGQYLREEPVDCQLIYTFVVGGNPDASNTELVDNARPMVLSLDHKDNPHDYQGKDIREPDVTLLNIRENMNEGKSQTWFAYAAQLAKDYPIDYIVKQDTDTILYLDRYFDFVDTMLPPAPYNRNIMAGSVVDKFWWGEDKVNRQAPAERWAIRKYGGLLHLYVEGQWYLMSPDLARTVQQQAVLGPEETQKYIAGHEDHDVSAMAFHSERPINLIIVSMQQRHWLHNVKISLGNGRWNRLWERETKRMHQYAQQKLMLPRR